MAPERKGWYDEVQARIYDWGSAAYNDAFSGFKDTLIRTSLAEAFAKSDTVTILELGIGTGER